jgi:hypothetical protein
MHVRRAPAVICGNLQLDVAAARTVVRTFSDMHPAQPAGPTPAPQPGPGATSARLLGLAGTPRSARRPALRALGPRSAR